MNRLLVALVAALAFCSPARADGRWSNLSPTTFVVVSTITPPASGTNVFALQNTSAGLDLWVNRIDVVSNTSGAATGGLMQFLVYTSTSLSPGGTSQVSTYGYASPFQAALLPGVSASTGPVNALLEGGLPILPPFQVNNAPGTATSTNISATYADNVPITNALFLPHGSNRAIVIQKVKTGATDVTDGTVLIRVVYTFK